MSNGKRQTSKRITLVDVAREAGVSRATASLVVRKSPVVGRDTRAHVEAVIDRLGYVADVGAARLRQGRSRTVGVILPNLSNPFFSEMLAGMETVLDAKDLALMVANSRESVDKQQSFLRRMREHDASGTILCAAAETPADVLQSARRWDMPIVQVLRRISDAADYAGTDYAGGMRQVVRHLAQLGHRHIVYAAGNRDHSALRERIEGLHLADELGLSLDISEIPLTHGDARDFAIRLMARRTPPTAIACFNDVIALGMLKGLRDLGVDVGTEVSVAGFDDVPEAALAYPTLTTVKTRPMAIGEAAARLLLKRLETPDAEPRALIEPTEIIARNSSGAAPTTPPSPSLTSRFPAF